jgi:HAD superfamily hydrolase (TIGR01509 family)
MGRVRPTLGLTPERPPSVRSARGYRCAVPSLPTPAAVLWDMDGTLVDTEPFWIEAETALVERFGGSWSHEQALALVGSGLEDSAAILQSHGVALGIEEIVDEMTDVVAERLRHGVPWRAGALELLRSVFDAGVPMALVTMSIRRMAEAVVAAMPFEPFSVVVSGSDVARPKPHPDPYERAAALLGVPTARCVAIEDSPTGLASAVAAGTVALGVPNAVPLPDGDGWTLWPSLEGRSFEDLAVLAAERSTVPR